MEVLTPRAPSTNTGSSEPKEDTSAQNECGVLSDKPPDYDGPYVDVVPPYTQTALPLPPYQEHFAPPPPYVSLSGGDLSGLEVEASPEGSSNRNRGYRRLNHSHTCHLFTANIRFTVAVTAFCILALGVAIAMVIVGGMNLLQCARVEVPVYLIIGGVLLMAELLLRVSLFFAAHHSTTHAHVIRRVRKMDIVLCLLFLWVCVGTVWVFRYSHVTCDDVGGDTMFNTTSTTSSSSSTTPAGTTFSSSSTTPAASCKDCSDKVYIFAFGSMLLQYLFVLFLGVTFCRNILRREN